VRARDTTLCLLEVGESIPLDDEVRGRIIMDR
jgi:hypothetical protein